MRLQRKRSNGLRLLALLALPFLLNLSACQTLMGADPVPSSVTPTKDLPLEQCIQFAVIHHWSGDRPTLERLREVLDGSLEPNQKLGRLRALLGDTEGTILQVKAHNRVYHALCPKEPL